MTTPICDFIKKYAEQMPIRLHMPGHKGDAELLGACNDITEIDGADVLYDAHGIIKESQENASALFGSAATHYSTEGSSLCIRAMLYLVACFARQEGREATVLAARNVHKSFVTAAALLDISTTWLYGTSGDLLTCPISLHTLEQRLMQERPLALYITSPDYLGGMVDIAAMAEVCHRHGVLLLVDNAHGAYLKFLSPSQHPMDLGADLCCDSAHKTLPVLTGGAYLHIGKGAPALFREQAETALSIFASTSPSYLILQSLDRANQVLSGEFPAQLATLVAALDSLRQALTACGYVFFGDEPCKLTLAAKAYGYTGEEIAEHLIKHGIVFEFCDKDMLVLMPSVQTSTAELQALQHALQLLPRHAPVTEQPPRLHSAKVVMPLKEALLARRERIPVECAEGRILSIIGVSCPPAVPILVCGEQIDATAIEALRYYGITHCSVVLD